MTHDDLINLGFKLIGEEENDPYYRLRFKPPFKFDISHLAGSLENNKFLLYGNSEVYTDPEALKIIIKTLGNEIAT